MTETSTNTPSMPLTPDMLRQLETLSTPPEPFTPGAPLFWDDPHISQHLLEAHLDPLEFHQCPLDGWEIDA